MIAIDTSRLAYCGECNHVDVAHRPSGECVVCSRVEGPCVAIVAVPAPYVLAEIVEGEIVELKAAVDEEWRSGAIVVTASADEHGSKPADPYSRRRARFNETAYVTSLSMMPAPRPAERSVEAFNPPELLTTEDIEALMRRENSGAGGGSSSSKGRARAPRRAPMGTVFAPIVSGEATTTRIQIDGFTRGEYEFLTWETGRARKIVTDYLAARKRGETPVVGLEFPSDRFARARRPRSVEAYLPDPAIEYLKTERGFARRLLLTIAYARGGDRIRSRDRHA